MTSLRFACSYAVTWKMQAIKLWKLRMVELRKNT